MALTKICTNCKSVIQSNFQRCPYCKKTSRNYSEEFSLNFIVGLISVIIFFIFITFLFYIFGFFSFISAIISYIIAIFFILVVIIGISNSLKK